MPKITMPWTGSTRRLDLLYAVPGETDRASGNYHDRMLTPLGRQQITCAAEAIKRARRLRPQAVMQLQHVKFPSIQQTTQLLSETLRLPVWPDNSLGDATTEQDLAAYLALPASTLVVPITPTGMRNLLLRLDPGQIEADWATTATGSVWHVQVVCSLNGPPLERSSKLVARLA